MSDRIPFASTRRPSALLLGFTVALAASLCAGCVSKSKYDALAEEKAALEAAKRASDAEKADLEQGLDAARSEAAGLEEQLRDAREETAELRRRLASANAPTPDEDSWDDALGLASDEEASERGDAVVSAKKPASASKEVRRVTRPSRTRAARLTS